MSFQQEFASAFGEKYKNLQLQSVVVKKGEDVLSVTFLYPSTDQELSVQEKQEIVKWLDDTLDLEGLSLRVKFMRAFVEEKLIRKAIANFFERKYKLVMTYISDQSFKIDITAIDVIVEVELSLRMHNFFSEHKIASELSKFLQDNFLTNFVISLKQNQQLVDEVDIENVEISTTYKVTKRFDVQIVKEVIGKDIPTKPEFLKGIKSPKSAVIVAGYIKKLERREFVIKKGKLAGQSKAYFTFVLDDGKGRMDCIYFCPKSQEKNMDVLEEFMYVLVQGDVQVQKISGKLQLVVDKLALASEVEKEPEQPVKKIQMGPVVEIEKIVALEQDSLFEQQQKYNNKIMGRKIVVFDCETTGLDRENDQIIELGAVKIENGNIVEKFSTFVKPTVRIPYEVTKLTGITDDMVVDAPPIENVIRDFYEFTRGCILSGHNVINFDMLFIKREGENAGLDFDNEVIDTMNEARVARLKISRFNLATVVKALGLTLEGAHRAWNDAYATAQVLLKLNETQRKYG